MSFITQLGCIALLVTLCGIAQSQCMGRVCSVVPVAPSCCYGDDLSTILQLAKALNQAECSPSSPSSCSCSSLNTDDIITKLINALIYATVGGKGPSGGGGHLLNLNGGLTVL